MAALAAEEHEAAGPAAAPAGDETVWADASGFLDHICDALDVGELVHDESFSLFEAMAALEIMDPKMDAGMDNGGPKSIQDAIDSGIAPLNLSVAQVLDVMDHLLSCEAAWHRGHSLAQTVYSSLYMLCIERTTSNPLLHAFCMATQATCRLLRNSVSKTHTHEVDVVPLTGRGYCWGCLQEEDLFVVAFGLPLVEAPPDVEHIAILDPVEAAVLRNLKEEPADQPLQDNPALEADYCRNVLFRLQFRKALYLSLFYMDCNEGLQTARRHITVALSMLPKIRLSSAFLSAHHPLPDPGNTCPTTASGRPAAGFDPNMTRSLLPPTPPRSMKLLPWNDVLDYFERLLHDLDFICSIPENLTFEALIQLIMDFQKGHPELVARSRMRLRVLRDNKFFGSDTPTEVIYKSIYPKGDQARNPVIGKFLQQAGWLAMDLVKVLCANPAWQCRKLARVLEDWSNLFQHLDILIADLRREGKEKTINEAPIVRWIACQCSWIAGEYLMLGFALDLYSWNEYYMIYWYLDHVLLTLLHYKSEREKEKGADPRAKKKWKKGKKGLKYQTLLNPDLLFVQSLSDLCKAFRWMLIGLQKDGLAPCRPTQFTSDFEVYMLRFEVLHRTLVPAPLPFVHYLEATKLEGSAAKFYTLSLDAFRDVQQRLRELASFHAKSGTSTSRAATEIGQMEQVTKKNVEALQQLLLLQRESAADVKVSMHFTQHPCFGTVIVQKNF